MIPGPPAPDLDGHGMHITTAAALARFKQHMIPHTFEVGLDHHRFLAYRLEERSPKDPLLICLHGFKNNAHSFADLIGRLDRPAIALDLRGFGSSRGPDRAYLTMSEYLADLKRLLSHLNVGRIALIGHSLGGRLATAWSAVYPETVSRLVVLEGIYRLYAPSDWPARYRRWLDQLDTALPPRPRIERARLEAFYLRQTEGIPLELARHLATEGVQRDDEGQLIPDWDAYHQRPTPAPFDDRMMQEALVQLRMPTLILQAAPPHPAATELSVTNPAICFRRIAGGHMLHWAQPQAVADAIGHWWKETDLEGGFSGSDLEPQTDPGPGDDPPKGGGVVGATVAVKPPSKGGN